MESSRLRLNYYPSTTVIEVADNINSVYLHSVLHNELVVRVSPYLPASQVLCVAFEKDDVTISAFVMSKRRSTLLNGTHEVYDKDNSTVKTRQGDFGSYEWYTQLPQAVLENAGQWTLSLSVFEPLNLGDPLGTMPIATSGVFTFNVNNSLAVDDEPVPTEFDILNLYVTAVQMAENSEAWAVGERNGEPVEEEDETYHNNAKYWAEQAEDKSASSKVWAEEAEAWAVGERDGEPVESTDETYNNNAKYWADKSEEYAGDSADSATEASGYADNAEESAGNANTYAQQASGYATNAQASAQSASGYASLSSGYADNSQASAQSASQSASQASNSESASELSATSASASASSAEASAQRAEQIASTIMPPIAVSDVTNPAFDSQAEYITISTPITDINGKVWQIADLKVGGTVWVIESGVPDRWVASVQNGVATLYRQEVETTIPVTSVNGQIGDIETYKQTYSATAHYYKGDWVSNSTGDLVYFCIQTAPIGTELTNRAYFRPIAIVGADGKISADVLPVVTVLLETEETETVAGESLPILTGTQLTQAYNGIVAGQTVTIANPDGDEHIRVLEAFADGNDIQIIVGYKDKLFKYSADGDITVVFNPADKQDKIDSTHKLSSSLIDGLADVATSGDYDDLSNKPTIPTVNNGTLTIQKNGTTVGTFGANTASDTTVDIEVPTELSELSDDSTHRTVTDAEKTEWDGKQDELESGVNIKTVNGQSLLGSGDIEIQGGGGIAQNEVIDRRETLPQATASSADFVEVGSVLYAKTKYIAWDVATITLSGTNITTAEVSGVTKYKIYDNNVYIGYFDTNGDWQEA